MAIAEMLDPEFHKVCLKNISDSTAAPDTSPPSRGIQIHGFDGTYARRIKTDSTGKLQVDVITIQNPPNFDVALSTRASENTLLGIKMQADRLMFDSASNLLISLSNATVKQPMDIQDHWQEPILLLPSGTRSSSGYSDDVDVGRFLCGEVFVDVTEVDGVSPTLDVYIEGRNQIIGKYTTLCYQLGINTVGVYNFTLSSIPFKFIRIKWVIGGTSPIFTFNVTGEFRA